MTLTHERMIVAEQLTASDSMVVHPPDIASIYKGSQTPSLLLQSN